MNQDHAPCLHCARFIPTGKRKAHEDGPGHCEGHDRPAHSTDRPCVLFLEQGSWSTRKAQQAPEQRKPLATHTVSRASAQPHRQPETT